MAHDEKFLTDDASSYTISVDMYNYQASKGHGFGHLGLAFNMLDTDNYEGVYIRIHTTYLGKTIPCLQRFKMSNGEFDGKWNIRSKCDGRPEGRTWFTLKVAVDNDKQEVMVYINEKLQGDFKGTGSSFGSTVIPRGGVIVAHGFNNTVFFKNYQIVKSN